MVYSAATSPYYFMKKFLFVIIIPLLTLFPTTPVFADEVADISVTYEANTTVNDWDAVFANCYDYACLSQYSYFTIIHHNGEFFNPILFYSRVYDPNYSVIRTIRASGYTSVTFDINNFDVLDFNGGLTFDSDFTFVLSNDSDVDCPQPVIPDCDDPFIVRLFEGSFWNVATALVSISVAILALFLVFRLIHGLIYGKGV